MRHGVPGTLRSTPVLFLASTRSRRAVARPVDDVGSQDVIAGWYTAAASRPSAAHSLAHRMGEKGRGRRMLLFMSSASPEVCKHTSQLAP